MMHICKNCGKPIHRVWPSDDYSTLIHTDPESGDHLSEKCFDGTDNYADTDQNI